MSASSFGGKHVRLRHWKSSIARIVIQAAAPPAHGGVMGEMDRNCIARRTDSATIMFGRLKSGGCRILLTFVGIARYYRSRDYWWK